MKQWRAGLSVAIPAFALGVLFGYAAFRLLGHGDAQANSAGLEAPVPDHLLRMNFYVVNIAAAQRQDHGYIVQANCSLLRSVVRAVRPDTYADNPAKLAEVTMQLRRAQELVASLNQAGLCGAPGGPTPHSDAPSN